MIEKQIDPLNLFEMECLRKAIKVGIISESEKNDYINRAKLSGKTIASLLFKDGKIDKVKVSKLLQEVSGLISFDPSYMNWDKNMVTEQIDLLPSDFMIKHMVFIRSRGNNIVSIGMINPWDEKLIDQIQCYTGLKVEPYVSSEMDLIDGFKKFFPEFKETEPDLFDETPLPDDNSRFINPTNTFNEQGHIFKNIDFLAQEVADIVNARPEIEEDYDLFDKVLHSSAVLKFVQEIFNQVMLKGASDFHFEPMEKTYRIRVRVDGELRIMWEFPKILYRVVNARLKMMADVPIEPILKPVDCRIGYNVILGKRVEYRVNIMPTINGEKVCCRVIDLEAGVVPLDIMGFSQRDITIFRRGIHSANGMVLVTGPTGSGKTTTLYSALGELNQPEVCIVTAEDPVEANLAGVNQVNCNPDKGVTFLDALKAFLRQDPNIIMVGEIRDKTTGEIAMKAAMTGHLVISTLHTNDAPSTINRLLNMDIPPFLIATGVNIIHAQRLARKICPNCKTTAEYPEKLIRDFALNKELFNEFTFYHGTGCEKCDNTGLKGRMGLFEILEITESIQELILKKATTIEIREKARQADGFFTLFEDGLQKVKQGLTTLDVVVSETM